VCCVLYHLQRLKDLSAAKFLAPVQSFSAQSRAHPWFYANKGEGEVVSQEIPNRDPLIGAKLSPSQRVTVKYFVVVTLLFLLQIAMGMVTAHYGVEGQGFYGIPLSQKPSRTFVGRKPVRGSRSTSGCSISSSRLRFGTWSVPAFWIHDQSTDCALLHAGLNTTACMRMVRSMACTARLVSG